MKGVSLLKSSNFLFRSYCTGSNIDSNKWTVAAAGSGAYSGKGFNDEAMS
jgi:hypothetical protein